MNEISELGDGDRKKSRVTKAVQSWSIHAVLIVVTLSGVTTSLRSSLHRNALQKESQRLAALCGSLDIKDPNRVWVTAVDMDADTAERRVLRYRIYLPANYDFQRIHRTGPISARTPRSLNRSGSSSWSTPKQRPVEEVWTVTIARNETGLMVHYIRPTGKGMHPVRRHANSSLSFDSIVVDQSGSDGPVSFSIDEPICLLRIRSVEPSQKQLDDKDIHKDTVYDGWYWYLVPTSVLAKFKAMQTGQTP